MKAQVQEDKGKVKDVTGKMLDDGGLELKGNIPKTPANFRPDLLI